MTLNIPNLHLKGVFFSHLILTTWGMQGGWSPVSYVFYNVIFMIVLLWGIHSKDSEEPIFMGTVINIASIFLDIITLCVYFPSFGNSSVSFSAWMAILNLILRILTTVLLYKLFLERQGTYGNFGIGGNVGDIFGTGGAKRSPYEDIDQATPQAVPQSSMDTGSPSHFSPGGLIDPPPYQH